MSEQTNYKIMRLTTLDVEKVINFFEKFFYRDEPLNTAVGLFNEPNAACHELKEHSVSCISEGTFSFFFFNTYTLSILVQGCMNW